MPLETSTTKQSFFCDHFRLFLTIFLVVLSLTLAIICFKESITATIVVLQSIQKHIQAMTEENAPQALFILFALHFIVGISPLPIQMILSVFCFLVIKNPIFCFVFVLFCCNVEALFVYFILSFSLFSSMREKMAKSSFYQALSAMSKPSPIMFSIETQMLLLPLSVKTCLLTLLDLPLLDLIIGFNLAEILFVFQTFLISAHIETMTEVAEGDNDWVYWAKVIGFGLSAVISLVLGIALGVRAHNKIKEKKEELIKKANELKKNEIEATA